MMKLHKPTHNQIGLVKFTFPIVVFAAVLAPALVQSTTITISGVLDASQVVDGGGSTSTATGFATVVIDDVLRTMTTDLSWAGLTGPTERAHLHDAPVCLREPAAQRVEGSFR